MTAPLCYIILLITLCSASNSSLSTLSCDSYISDSIVSSNDIKYYLFNNSMHQNQNDESYSVLFDLCPISNPSTFDTIIYICDLHSNLLEFNDNSENCPNQQSQIVFHPNDTQYIIGIGANNSESGIFHLNITCNYNLSMNQPTTFITTQPSSDPGMVTCDSLVHGVITPTYIIHYYSFTTNKSTQLFLSTCPNGSTSTFDIDLYIYDTNLTEIAYNDWGNGCEQWLSQINIPLTPGSYIIGVRGYGYPYIGNNYGDYSLSIACTTIAPTTAHPSMSPTLPTVSDSFVDDLYCNGIVTAYQIQPADVCISESMSSSSMFQCNNGRISQLQWYNSNNCSGMASYTSDNYCGSFTTYNISCQEFCDIGPCDYARVKAYYNASDCDGDIPKGSGLYYYESVYILNYCQNTGFGYGRKWQEDGSYLQLETYLSSNCAGVPYSTSNQYEIGSTCTNDPIYGITATLTTIGTVSGTKSPTQTPTIPTLEPSNSPTISTDSPTTANPTSPTISPTTTAPTMPTLEPTHEPSLPDTFIDDLYCDGLITEYQSTPAGVCMIIGNQARMFQCINGRIAQKIWYGSDNINCSGNPLQIQFNFCDSYPSNETCIESCNLGPCDYFLVASYHNASYCDGDIPMGSGIYSYESAYILDFCQSGTKFTIDDTYISVSTYATPNCEGNPWFTYPQQQIGSSCDTHPNYGVSAQLVSIGTAIGTKGPSYAPTFQTASPTHQPSVIPTISTISPTFNPTIPTTNPTTSEPTTVTIPPTISPSDNPTIPSLAPTTYSPTTPTLEPTFEPTMPVTPNDLPCDGIVVGSHTMPAGVCWVPSSTSQMFECIDGRMSFTQWPESTNCSGRGYSINNYCEVYGFDSNICQGFCGKGPCDYFELKHYYNASYCDGDSPIGSGMKYSSQSLILNHCQNVRENQAYKYRVNGDYVYTEYYSTSNCSGNVANVYPLRIGSTCTNNQEYGVEAQEVIIATAPGTELPSSTPTIPSVSPTYAPSATPTVPTLSPTHTSKTLCGENKWCFDVDLYPIFGNETSQMVGMANEINEEDTELYIQFTSKYEDCVAPRISVSFEEIDFSSQYEYFEIFDNNDQFIYKCNGTQDANCGHWIQCLQDYPLGIVKIAAESTYNITIKTSGFNARCSSSTHSYSANIGLSITCSSETATPTTEPTPKPTDYQTTDLFGNLTVYAINCGDSFQGEISYPDTYSYLYQLIDDISIGTNIFIDTCYPETDLDLRLMVVPLPYNLTNLTNEVPDGYLNVSGIGCVQGEYVHEIPRSDILIAIIPYIPNLNNGFFFPTGGPFKMTVSCYTYSPTNAPSQTPTIAPTISPSAAPTIPPTAAPTRYPTEMNIYDSYIDVTYVISSVSVVFIDYMARDFMNIIGDVTMIIEQGYADHKQWSSTLEFQSFWLQILTMNDEKLTSLANEQGLSPLLQYFNQNGGFILKSKIECSLFICDRIRYGYDQLKFEETVRDLLDVYFQEHALSINADETESSLAFSVLSMSELYTLDPENDDGIHPFVWILCIILVIFVLIFSGCCYKQYKTTKELNAKTIYIKNPMVIPIAIGLYDSSPTNPEIPGKLKNLNGVQVDLDSIITLFGDRGLNYYISPNYNQYETESYKISWTEKELVDFLQKKADELEDNLKYEELQRCYDGLVVIFTGHGMDRFVITSDYKLVSKVAIHRIFSAKKPRNRKIPRIFLFDCCSGNRERDYAHSRNSIAKDQGKSVGISSDPDDEKYLDTKDIGKNIQMDDIARKESIIWANDEENPDFRLVTIEAANEGFQSKMSLNKGSYVITQFIQRLENNICNNKNRKFMNEILDEIQEKLHNDGKQLMVKTMNNKTEFIKFMENGNNTFTKQENALSDTDGNSYINGGAIVSTPASPTMTVSEQHDGDGVNEHNREFPKVDELVALSSMSVDEDNEGGQIQSRVNDFNDGVMMEMAAIINTRK